MPKDSKSKKIVLLDSHAIIHRAYHALPEFMSSKGEPTGALYGLSTMIMRIIDDLRPDFIVACYDLPEKTFRHEAYDGYKALRSKADEALILQLNQSREIFEAFSIPIYDAPSFEADDVLGSIVEILKDEKNLQIVIASGDMDTMQLVSGDRVCVYTLKKGLNDTILYNEQAVFERFGFAPNLLPDYKGLRGDASDNIIGIKGIGEKTATILISKFGSIESIYKKIKSKEGILEMKEAGLTDRILNLIKDNEEEAVFSKTLATIRRDAPIDFVLPEKTFWENLDFSKVEKMFIKFEFRSLFTRLKNFIASGDKKHVKEEVVSPESKDIDARLLQETSIALWLLNSNIATPSLEDMLHFSGTRDFNSAREYIFKELKEKNLFPVFEEIEKPIIDRVSEMEKNGILIDQDYFKNLSSVYHKELDKLTESIYAEAGMTFNINSPKQLAEVLFVKLGLKSSKKKGKSGNLSTKVSVLEELEDEHKIVKEIMAYRELQKLLSTYVDVIPKMVSPDGRLHAKFIQNGTTTGRFSSSDPNLQNLPIKTELGRRIRNGFVAKPKYKLCAFDYSQIELRVAAILSKDKKMIEIFGSGEDIHSGVASLVFGVPVTEVDGEMRRRAKVINFGIIYGMGVSALKKNLGSTREEAQRFYDDYFEQFVMVKDYLEGVKAYAKKHLYTETLFGRRRYFENINSRIPFLQNMAERTAINAPIQGTATADIIKLAIRFVHEDLEARGLTNDVRLIMQIHDELVYEVKEDLVSEVVPLIKNAMEGVLFRSYLKYKSEVPIVVNSGVGSNLGEVK